MQFILFILFILTSILLIGVILIQQPKTSTGLFSGTGQSLLGTSGKTFWTKFTIVLAVVFMAICLLYATLSHNPAKDTVADKIEKQQQQQAQALQQQAPAQPPSGGEAMPPANPPAQKASNAVPPNAPVQKAPVMPAKAPAAPGDAKK
jgi:protein translocase SecG subunit